jgi:signal transduction histidine kinase
LQEAILKAPAHRSGITNRIAKPPHQPEVVPAPAFRINKTRVEFTELLSAAVERSRPSIKKSGASLLMKFPFSPIVVDGDSKRLMQLLMNLLDNAVKCSSKGGHINLTLDRLGKYALVSVEDSGSGFPEEMLSRVFDGQARDDRPAAHAQSAAVSGLSLVKHIAELHGGAVRVHSDGPHRGAQFVVALPIISRTM